MEYLNIHHHHKVLKWTIRYINTLRTSSTIHPSHPSHPPKKSHAPPERWSRRSRWRLIGAPSCERGRWDPSFARSHERYGRLMKIGSVNFGSMNWKKRGMYTSSIWKTSNIYIYILQFRLEVSWLWMIMVVNVLKYCNMEILSMGFHQYPELARFSSS